MDGRQHIELLAIGGSAGSLAVVLKLIRHFHKEMKLAVVLVFHRKQSDDNVLVDVLKTKTSCRVLEAEDKDEIVPGTIYLAPADYHLLIEKNATVTLDDSERINFSRPSIDVTFESAADAYGSSLACMLLSGANDDGVAGLVNAKESGALIIVQDPRSAEVSFMPEQAISSVSVDFILTDQNMEEIIKVISGNS